MIVHTPKLLTPEECASLIELALTTPAPKIPALHLAKLVDLGYVLITPRGAVVTGDGPIRITENDNRKRMIGNGALGNLDACEGRKRLCLHKNDGCGDHEQYPDADDDCDKCKFAHC